MEDEKSIIEEILFNNNLIKVDNDYNICKATIKIKLNIHIVSGFFIKLKRNYKDFYCIMTNQHVITPELINNKNEILIKYDNEKKYLIIKLDIKERIVQFFKEECF